MIFIILLIVSALVISGCAGFFSIYGLASIFTGSFWSIVIMGSSLEVGKLMAASYVYRFWDKINFLMKTYLISAILVLMFITSIGIFGFLSASYQQDSIPLKEMSALVDEYKAEKTILDARKVQINDDIASLPNNYVNGRQRLLETYKPELLKIDSRLDTLRVDLADIQKQKVTQESHTGPIIYIAKVMGREVDDAIKYMILMIIFAFDPLALVLVLAANSAIADRKPTHDKKKTEDDELNRTQVVEEVIEEAVDEVDEFIERPKVITGYDSLDEKPNESVVSEETQKLINEVNIKKDIIRNVRKA